MRGIINMCQFFFFCNRFCVRRSGLTAVFVVKFESSCCLMLAIDQLHRRRVTNKNLSKLLRGPGNGGIQAFFFF